MPYFRLTLETDRGPVSVLHALAELPRVGDAITFASGRTARIQTAEPTSTP